MLTSQELQTNVQSAAQYRERRHPQWTENYRLYRDTVITNRLTQRQSVNVPLMKETLRTIRANISPVADLQFESLDNDKQKELFKNEYWRHVAKENRLTLLDYVDTNQELLYGRSFIKLNIVDGQVRLEVIDPQDILELAQAATLAPVAQQIPQRLSLNAAHQAPTVSQLVKPLHYL